MPRGEERGVGKEGDGKKRRIRNYWKRWKEKGGCEDNREQMSERKGSPNITESRIKVNQLHLQIAHAWPWPVMPSLWGSLSPDYMKLG